MKSILALIRLMRPTQWVKNGFVVMPLIFSGHLQVYEDVVRALGVMAAFCLASSATYIFNDYVDREQDRAHPVKRRRPLASGETSAWAALLLMSALLVAALAVVVFLVGRTESIVLLLSYLGLQVLYSFLLKNIVILDVLSIATGFLLRVLAGASAISVGVSSWLILCTFSLATLLALGKRRHEVVILNNDATNHRPVLENYNVAFLDQLLQISTTSTFIFYCLYSVRGNPDVGIASEKMMLTIPLVTYGIFRYLYLVYHKGDGGSPTNLLLNDAPLLVCTIIWLVACVGIIYFTFPGPLP
ncbi:MAG: decaprenyl-phosphate phosphoribosyltransferase [Thermodesulfobacteriota bacterium]